MMAFFGSKPFIGSLFIRGRVRRITRRVHRALQTRWLQGRTEARGVLARARIPQPGAGPRGALGTAPVEKLKEWKQEKRKRTPLALLHDPPAELRPRGPKRDFLERT